VRREVSLMLQPEVEVGDFVLVHAGYAIGVVDEAEANATLDLLRQAADSLGTP
jgi:hydrogenase expression/formation protein HypC